jgi:hypothetical protein
MKKLVMFLMLCCSSAVFALTIQMPSAEILKEKLGAMGLGHFAEETTIIADLANQKKEPMGIKLAVELVVRDYNHTMKTKISAALLLSELLKDSSEALAELQEESHKASLDRIRSLLAPQNKRRVC